MRFIAALDDVAFAFRILSAGTGGGYNFAAFWVWIISGGGTATLVFAAVTFGIAGKVSG